MAQSWSTSLLLFVVRMAAGTFLVWKHVLCVCGCVSKNTLTICFFRNLEILGSEQLKMSPQHEIIQNETDYTHNNLVGSPFGTSLELAALSASIIALGGLLWTYCNSGDIEHDSSIDSKLSESDSDWDMAFAKLDITFPFWPFSAPYFCMLRVKSLGILSLARFM